MAKDAWLGSGRPKTPAPRIAASPCANWTCRSTASGMTRRARARPGASSEVRSLSFAERARDLVRQRFEHIGQEGAGASLDEDLGRHARQELEALEPGDLVPGAR